MVQNVVLAWIVTWAVVVAIALARDATGLALYGPVGLLVAPIVTVVVGLWAPLLSAGVTHLSARIRGHRSA